MARGRGRPKGSTGGLPSSDRSRIRAIAREHTSDAIATLVFCMKDPKELGRTRVAAAEALLDRGWDKCPTAATEESLELQKLQVQKLAFEVRAIQAAAEAEGNTGTVISLEKVLEQMRAHFGEGRSYPVSDIMPEHKPAMIASIKKESDQPDTV